MRHQARIAGEIRQIDGDFDHLADFVLAQAIPEMLESELAVTLRQAGVKYQLEGTNEVALANFILTDNNDALARFDVESRKIREIAYLDS